LRREPPERRLPPESSTFADKPAAIRASANRARSSDKSSGIRGLGIDLPSTIFDDCVTIRRLSNPGPRASSGTGDQDPTPWLHPTAGHGYRTKDDEVTVDMLEGTFTHVRDRCTFEMLVETFALKDPGLRAMAEIVHDIDVKDDKFHRVEAPGLASLVAAIALTRREDQARIAFGGEILAALLELYRRKGGAAEEA
jgi:hypothetical protein